MKTLVHEIKIQLLKSWLQILKILGLFLTPMVYVIILIFAVWQPLDSVNKAPIAVLDTSERAYLYTDAFYKKDPKDESYHLGIVLDKDKNMVKADEVSIEEINANRDNYVFNVKDEFGEYIKLSEEVKEEQILSISFFDLMIKSNVLTDNGNGTYSTQEIGTIKFNNIKYYEGQEAIDRKHSSKDMLQLVIKDDYLLKDVNFLGSILMGQEAMDNNPLEIEPLEVISNASHNFVLSYLVDNVSLYKEAVIIDLFFAALKGMTIDNELLNWLVITAEEFKDKLSDSIIQMNNDGTTTTRDFGFGLSEFFILIGISVGIISQMLLFKRKPLSKYKSWTRYYFDKWALMNITTLIQVAFIMLALAISPISQIGAYPLFLLWIWLSWFGIVFTTICTSVWMISKIKLVGLFIMVTYLVLNIASGWGVFPSYLQSWFYDWISYLMPFRYSMQGEGIIIYSIGALNAPHGTSTQMLIYFASMVPFVLISLLIAYVSSFRIKEYKYGTYSKKILLKAANDLNLSNMVKLIEGLKYNKWYVLDDQKDMQLIKDHLTNIVYKEKVFNWVSKNS